MGRTSEICAKVCQLQRFALVTLIGAPLLLSFACSGSEVVGGGSGGAGSGATGGRNTVTGGRNAGTGSGSSTDGGGPNPDGGAGGQTGEPCAGKIVEEGGCYQDDAFCIPRADGTYCTGFAPFVCPPGQVRVDFGRCDFPEIGGAGGDGGAGGEGGAAQGGAP